MANVLSREVEVMKYLDKYVHLLQHTLDKVWKGLDPVKVEVRHGRKFIKVVKVGQHQTMVHSFVDRSNGNLHKPAGWAAPSKTVNYNIVEDFDAIVKNIDAYGAYLYKNNPFKK